MFHLFQRKQSERDDTLDGRISPFGPRIALVRPDQFCNLLDVDTPSKPWLPANLMQLHFCVPQNRAPISIGCKDS
jgi:hypothetical protein